VTGGRPERCPCCGSSELARCTVLWPGLIAEWGLSPEEAEYIDRQQGLHCTACGSNLRSMALAAALLRVFSYDGLFREFVVAEKTQALRILEVNEAGMLTQFLSRARGHRLVSFPEVDLRALPFPEGSFDLVVHSDTLEHVEDPLRALGECRRVLRPGGMCAFTVPIVVGRLTATREGKPPSYHLAEGQPRDDVRVYTEFGADAWTHVLRAGFSECRITSLEYPAAQALVAIR
jgi:SAM-dependent methyltransferase